LRSAVRFYATAGHLADNGLQHALKSLVQRNALATCTARSRSACGKPLPSRGRR
jgi:hypothetical protein